MCGITVTACPAETVRPGEPSKHLLQPRHIRYTRDGFTGYPEAVRTEKDPLCSSFILHRGSVLNIGISHAYPSSHCICGEYPGSICLCSLLCGPSSGTPIHRWGIRALLFHRPFLLFRISGEHLQAPPALLPVFRFTAGTPCSIRSLDSLLSSHPYLFLCLKYTKFCEICQRKLCTIFNFNFRVTCTKTAADFPCKMCAFMLDKSPRDTV